VSRAKIEAELLAALDKSLASPTWRDIESFRDVRDVIKEGFQYGGEDANADRVRTGLTTLVKNAELRDLEWMLKEYRELYVPGKVD